MWKFDMIFSLKCTANEIAPQHSMNNSAPCSKLYLLPQYLTGSLVQPWYYFV